MMNTTAPTKVTFKTPRPVPKFYTTKEPTFSTKKKDKQQRAYNSSALQPTLRPLADYVRSAPAPPRMLNHRFLDQKPSFVTCKSQSESFLELMVGTYDESCHATYFDQCFTLEEKIGEGSFGEVFRCRSKEDGCEYAVKRSRQDFRSEGDRNAKLTEVLKHQDLPKHPNLVRLYRAWEERGRLYIQTELCKTSLADKLMNQDGPLAEKEVWLYYADLLQAVKHLHAHDLMHLDIKPENIFISYDGVCKLGDFGLVCDLSKEGAENAQEGDSKYMAPELLHAAPTPAADIFSLGMSVLEIATNLDVPTRGPGWHMLRSNRLPETLMQHVSSDLQRAIRCMVQANAQRRPSAADLLGQPALRPVLFRRNAYLTWRSTWNRGRETLFNVYLFLSILLLYVWEHVLLGSIAWFSTKGGRAQHHSSRLPHSAQHTPVNLPRYVFDQDEHKVASQLLFDDDDDEGSHSERAESPSDMMLMREERPSSPENDFLRNGVHDLSSIASSPIQHDTQQTIGSPPSLPPRHPPGWKPHRLELFDEDTSGSDEHGDSLQPVSSTPAPRRRSTRLRQQQQQQHGQGSRQHTHGQGGRQQQQQHRVPQTERIVRSKRFRPDNQALNRSFGAFGDYKRPASIEEVNEPLSNSPYCRRHLSPTENGGLDDSPTLFRRISPGPRSLTKTSTLANTTAPTRKLKLVGTNKFENMFDDNPGSSSADEF